MSSVASPEPSASNARSASHRTVPELLAPAGDWECAKAAVENGADAIYFGLDKFNARMRAHNFTDADLPRLMQFLHQRGVKGYVTFNTLVFENELADAENYLRTIIASGVDAAIVQDVGIARMIRALSPDFPIHASTQMTITSVAGVEFARELGCNLVVLARECSIKEIEKIQKILNDKFRMTNGMDSPAEPATAIRHPSFPLEVFVHGALCVAYSGQCLTSESLGGRSANRGECAQACRMPYELISDGKLVPLSDKKYLLSPQDLAGLEVLPELIRGGVASLKIEGRLKTPEYVANITRVYREALDKLQSENSPQSVARVEPLNRNDDRDFRLPLRHEVGERAGGEAALRVQGVSGQSGENSSDARKSQIENCKYDLEMAFSRGLYTGWFGGINNQQLVHARFGKKRGVFLGEVESVLRDAVVINLAGPLKPGDGVVFDAGKPEGKEEGGRVYEVRKKSGQGEKTSPGTRNTQHATRNTQPVELHFGHGDIDFNRVHAGDKLWKTSDPELDRHLRQSFAGDSPKFQRPVEMEVHGAVGKPLTLIVRDEQGHIVQMDSAMPLAKAERQPLGTERLREQLGRLGGTPFKLGELKNLLAGDVLLPVSELNRLRREVVTALFQQRALPKRWTLNEPATRNPQPATAPNASTDPKLIVLVRNLAQLEAALKAGVETLYCEFENPKKYRDAVAAVRASTSSARSEIFVTPPRIFKTGEEWTLEQVRSCEADGYLVRNYDHLNFFAGDRRVGDFSLNIANHFSADYFKNKFGLERVTASYDLNFQQLEALLQGAPPDWFEVTIHQHMPMFHMEHCVFCAFLSSGTDYTNCGRPCDKHDVKLRDRVGMEHPLKADVGCRNTVFNALAQTGAEYAERMLALGVRNFRIEFLNETPEQVDQTISKYRQLLRGEISGTELWRELRLMNQLGVTRGQMAGSRV
jgi:U32 family peptidase